MESGLNPTPRSSTPMEKLSRPFTLSSLVLRLEKNTEPVRWERNRKVAVAL